MYRLTALVIVSIPWVLAAIDVALYKCLGNAGTISWVMLCTAARHPLVRFCTAYSFGVLQGHFYIPAFGVAAPPTYLVLARMVVALSPLIAAMIVIAGTADDDPAQLRPLTPAEQVWVGVEIVAATAIGLAVGRFTLAQHPAP